MAGQIFVTDGLGFWSRVAACLLDKHPGWTFTGTHPHPLGYGGAALINANVARNCRDGLSCLSPPFGGDFSEGPRNNSLCF